MTISFSCPSCGKAFAVSAAMAGRAGKCKGCGRPITVPAATSAQGEQEHDPGPDGYGLAEPVRVASVAESASAFVHAPANPRPVDRAAGGSRAGGGTVKKKRKREAEQVSFVARHARQFGVAGTVVLAVLGLTAMVAPGGMTIVGGALAAIGIVVVLVGYGLAVYIAFSEDGVHGWACLIFPFYMAYYIARNWEEMWPWFATMTVGAGLITLAGMILGVGEEPPPKPDAAEVGAARPSGLGAEAIARLGVVPRGAATATAMGA